MNAEIILRRRAELTPDREALLETGTGRRYTFAELERRAAQTARWLTTVGVRPGDRVAVLANNGVLFVDLLFACLKLGAIFNPLNWRLAPPELAYIVQDSRPTVLIAGPPYSDLAEKLRGAADIPVTAGYDGAIMASGVAFEIDVATMAETFLPGQEMNGDEPGCLMYTSGTTGRPKGALIPHRQILWNAINTVISWELSAQDVSPIFTPMFHAGGLFVFLTPLLYCGGRLIITRSFEAAKALQTIERERCTVILGVPTLFQMWLETSELGHTNLKKVRWFISGGAPCPPALIRRWTAKTGTVLKQGYGLTEAGTNCFSMTAEEALGKVGSVGRPIFHSKMRLIDEQNNEVSVGETGELLIAGPHVMSGYWQNPAATAQTLQDGWLHTGDMARQDSNGFFYIVGRFKDMIISGGENIYAAEVEAAMIDHPTVQECALIGKPDDKWGEIGVMIVVPVNRDAHPNPQELADHCSQRLARYKVPREFIFAESLPYSPYGKVEKAKLKGKYLPLKN